MRELAELSGIVLLIIAAVLGVVLLATTPFALLGWVVTTIISLFTTISVSYFDCVAVGIGVSIVAQLISRAKYK